jgi:hypothetical protein
MAGRIKMAKRPIDVHLVAPDARIGPAVRWTPGNLTSRPVADEVPSRRLEEAVGLLEARRDGSVPAKGGLGDGGSMG